MQNASQKYFSSVADYSHSFNGMENVEEITGTKSHLDFGARIYDSRVGRWLSTDEYESKYAFLSPYVFAANSSIVIVDKDGNDIFIVNSDGTITNVKNVDEADVGDGIGYQTLKSTASGKQLLEKYENNAEEHIYITVGSVSELNQQANTSHINGEIPDQAVGNSITGLTGDASVFNGVTIQASGESTFIVINEDFVNGKGEFVGKDNSVYSKAAVLFHEIKAHVEMDDAVNSAVDKAFGMVNPTKEQKAAKKDEISHGPDFYGSKGSGFNTQNHPGTPAAQIHKELTDLKAINNKKSNSSVVTSGSGDSAKNAAIVASSKLASQKK